MFKGEMRAVRHHFRIGSVVQLHGLLLHVSDGSVCTQRQGDEEHTCTVDKENTKSALCPQATKLLLMGLDSHWFEKGTQAVNP